VSHVQTTLDRGEFKLNSDGISQINNWQGGFDGFFRGEPRERHQKWKNAAQGWDAGQCVQRLANEASREK
jgi:hypothetical protein